MLQTMLLCMLYALLFNQRRNHHIVCVHYTSDYCIAIVAICTAGLDWDVLESDKYYI